MSFSRKRQFKKLALNVVDCTLDKPPIYLKSTPCLSNWYSVCVVIFVLDSGFSLVFKNVCSLFTVNALHNLEIPFSQQLKFLREQNIHEGILILDNGFVKLVVSTIKIVKHPSVEEL